MAVNCATEATKEMPKPGHTRKGEPIRKGRDLWVIVIRNDLGQVLDAVQTRETVFARLQDTDWHIRLDAVESLAIEAGEGDDRAANAVLAALSDSEHNVRFAAVLAVAVSSSIPMSKRAAILTELLLSECNVEVRNIISEALQSLFATGKA